MYSNRVCTYVQYIIIRENGSTAKKYGRPIQCIINIIYLHVSSPVVIGCYGKLF